MRISIHASFVNSHRERKHLVLVGVDHVAQILDFRTFGQKVYNDLATSWWIVLLGLLLATILSLAWIVVMRLAECEEASRVRRSIKILLVINRFVAAVMVWTSLLLAVGLLVVSSVFTFIKYWDLKDVPEAQGSWLDQGETVYKAFRQESGNYSISSASLRAYDQPECLHGAKHNVAGPVHNIGGSFGHRSPHPPFPSIKVR